MAGIREKYAYRSVRGAGPRGASAVMSPCLIVFLATGWALIAPAQEQSEDQDSTDLYVVNSDGSHLSRITHDDAMEQDSEWSPRGNTIAYVVHDLRVRADIHLIEADGSNSRKLTDGQSFNFSPSWSPDGKRIAFSSSRLGMLRIFVMDADGSNVHCLTRDFKPKCFHEHPRWSPSGDSIAFYLVDGDLGQSKARICLANPEGGKPEVRASKKGSIRLLEWVPETKNLMLLLNATRRDAASLWRVSSVKGSMSSYVESKACLSTGSLAISRDGSAWAYPRALQQAEFYNPQEPINLTPWYKPVRPRWPDRWARPSRAPTFGCQIVVSDGQGSNARMITRERFRDNAGYMRFSFSPDGSRLVALRAGNGWNPITASSVLIAGPAPKQMGWLFPGKNGELIVPPDGMAPVPGSLLVYSLPKSLKLTLFDDPTAPPYGYVVKGGKLLLLVTGIHRGQRPASSEEWKAIGRGNHFKLPPANTVVSKFPPFSPEKGGSLSGAIGWTMLLADGSMYRPKTKEIPANALWVQRAGDGLDLVHAGPLYSGVYAHVGADRRIELSETPDPDSQTYPLWPFIDEAKHPAAPPEGFYVPRDYPQDMVYIVFSTGVVEAFKAKTPEDK